MNASYLRAEFLGPVQTALRELAQAQQHLRRARAANSLPSSVRLAIRASDDEVERQRQLLLELVEGPRPGCPELAQAAPTEPADPTESAIPNRYPIYRTRPLES